MTTNPQAVSGRTPVLAVTALAMAGDREKVLCRLRRGENLDRIEREKDEFFCTVYEAYEQIHLADPERVHKIDSDRSIEEIFEDVCADIDALLR